MDRGTVRPAVCCHHVNIQTAAVVERSMSGADLALGVAAYDGSEQLNLWHGSAFSSVTPE